MNIQAVPFEMLDGQAVYEMCVLRQHVFVVEWLVASIAVADADWRPVFTHGQETYDAALAAGGKALARETARVGREGWMSLLGPLTRTRGAWSVAALRALLADDAKRLRIL